jgi:hypothetical protein
MSSPIILPSQPYTVDDLLRNMMKDPRIAARVRRDPKYAAQLRFQITAQMRALTVAPTSNQAAEVRRAPIGTFLGAMPMATGSTSVADMVRAQREGFLMADGVQVSGNYMTELQAEKGGITAPRMPSVGFPAAQSYSYPSRKMIVGAALSATPEARDFTGTRQPLPTASFNPGAFVMSRPDSLNNSLVINRPVQMPSVRDLYPQGSQYAEMASASPADERRRNLSTLLGLPEMPSVRPAPQSGMNPRARFLRSGLRGFSKPGGEGPFKANSSYAVKKDPWFILREGVDKIAAETDDTGSKSFAWLTGLVSWADPYVIPVLDPGRKGTPSEDAAYNQYLSRQLVFKAAKCGVADVATGKSKDPGFCIMEALKSMARGIIVATILSDKIDLGAIKAPDGQNLNDWLNKNIQNIVPEEYRALVSGINLMPLDLTESPIRRYMIEQAYEEIWQQPLKDAWFEAISNELRNRKSGSLATAVTVIKDPKFAPTATPPVVALKPDALPVTPTMDAPLEDAKKEEKTKGDKTARKGAQDFNRLRAGKGGSDNMPLIIGGAAVAAAALIGLGIYFKGKYTTPT